MNSDWMMPDEIFSWLEENLEPRAKILEFGSGHGSIRLSEQFELISVEHNPDWLGLSASTYIHAEIQENAVSTKHKQNGWYNPQPIIDAITSQQISVFIVDGPPGDIGRHGLLSITDILPKNAIFIVDDVHREDELNLLEQLLAWHGGKCIIHSSVYENGKERNWAVLQPRKEEADS